MSVTEHSERLAPAPGAADVSPRRFRAQTVEEALRQARALLGDDASIIEANRIRRGGIGGFFATELGVEVLAVAGDVDTDRTAPAVTSTTSTTSTTAELELDLEHAPAVAPASSPRRARQSWRNAAREHAGAGGAGDAQQVMPGLTQMLDRAEASERAAAAAIHPETDRSHLPGSDGFGPVGRGTFAEHFLRELIEDAQALRRPDADAASVDAGPLDAATVDAATVDAATVDARADTANERPGDRNRTLPQSGETPPARRTGLSSPSTSPLGTPTVLGSAASRMAGRTADEPASDQLAPELDVSDAPSSDPGTSPRPMPVLRRSRQLVLGEDDAATTSDRAAQPADEVAADAPASAAVSPGADGGIADLVERCLQFGANASGANTPSKVALAVTMHDGSVMKLTLELQQPQPAKPARRKPAAAKRAPR